MIENPRFLPVAPGLFVFLSRFRTVFDNDGYITKLKTTRHALDLIGWATPQQTAWDDMTPVIYDSRLKRSVILDESNQYKDPYYDEESETWLDMNYGVSYLVVYVGSKRPSRRYWKKCENALLRRAQTGHSPEVAYASHILGEIESNHWFEGLVNNNNQPNGGV